MDKNVSKALNEEIGSKLSQMSKIDVNDEDYITATNAVSSLIEQSNDYEKIISERYSIVNESLKMVCGAVSAASLTIMVLKFEENGILRSKVWSWIPKLWNSKM